MFVKKNGPKNSLTNSVKHQPKFICLNLDQDAVTFLIQNQMEKIIVRTCKYNLKVDILGDVSKCKSAALLFFCSARRDG